MTDIQTTDWRQTDVTLHHKRDRSYERLKIIYGRYSPPCGRRGLLLGPSWFVAVIAVAVVVCSRHGFGRQSSMWPSWTSFRAVMVCGRHSIESLAPGLFCLFIRLLRARLQRRFLRRMTCFHTNGLRHVVNAPFGQWWNWPKRTGGGVRSRNVWNFTQGLKFKAHFHSKISVCRHELGVEPSNPPTIPTLLLGRKCSVQEYKSRLFRRVDRPPQRFRAKLNGTVLIPGRQQCCFKAVLFSSHSSAHARRQSPCRRGNYQFHVFLLIIIGQYFFTLLYTVFSRLHCCNIAMLICWRQLSDSRGRSLLKPAIDCLVWSRLMTYTICPCWCMRLQRTSVQLQHRLK